MKHWAIITGAGTGIGAGLVREFVKVTSLSVLAIGRKLEPLEKTKSQCEKPENVFILSADISKDEDLERIRQAIPENDCVKYLVQNAAIGVPDKLVDIKRHDFEYAMSVNVTAPLFLTQILLPKLQKCQGRILHLGTGVAFNPQIGTITYGVTKMAFHRLFTQLQVELSNTDVKIASLLPGVIDTEGLWEHIDLAKKQNLPHVSYFDHVIKDGEIRSADYAAKFIKYVLVDSPDSEYSKQWNIHDESHWALWK